MQGGDTQTESRWTLAIGVVVVVALLGAFLVARPMLTERASDPNVLTSDDVRRFGYEDAAARLLAGIWDSSYGPTVVKLGGKVEPAPGSSDGDVTLTADHSKVDVDARAERASTAHERAAAIADAVPMTATGQASVTQLIEAQRAVEASATEGSPGGEIVAMTVTPTAVEGHVSDPVHNHWVEVTLAVSEEYRDGIVSEGEETAIVVFDPESHHVIDAALVTWDEHVD